MVFQMALAALRIMKIAIGILTEQISWGVKLRENFSTLDLTAS